MRLGAPLFDDCSTPARWVEAVRRKGYRAAYCPLSSDASDEQVRAYESAARDADIVIAEVGAWSNPLSPDEDERRAALDKCKRSLDLAERIGARCCVNIAGSRGAQWDGPHPLNLTEETFALIVQTTQEIIDAVGPSRTVYSLETMPWAYPDTPGAYGRLLKAINRPGFGVHLDPVNMITSPQRFYGNSDFLRLCFATLGKEIRAVHAKDIVLRPQLTVHLDEARPGEGGLDYHTLLREMDKLDSDVPLLLEHLPGEDDYDVSARFVRGVASELGVSL